MSTSPLRPDLYRAIFDASGDAVLIQDGSRIIDFNDAALELFKPQSKSDLMGAHPADFSPRQQPGGQNSRSLAEQHIAIALSQGAERFDWISCDMDGHDFASEIQLARFDWDGRKLLRASIHDVEKDLTRSGQRSHAYFKSLFDNSPEGIVIVDDRDYILDANPGFERLFQRQRDQLIGRDLNELIVPPGLRDEAVDYSNRALGGITGVIGDTVRLRRDGSELRVSIMGAPVAIGGKRIGVCGIYRDMTTYHQSREQLRQTEERLRVVVENLPVILFMLDQDGIFTLTQGLGLRSLGIQPDQNTGRSIYELLAGQPQLIEAFEHALAGRTRVVRHELEHVTFETQFSPLEDAHGNVTSVIGLGRDITENQEIKRRLEYMAHHDTLTGLPNRVLFQDRIDRARKHAQSTSTSFAVLLINLDRFKKVNESLGHAAGDRILRAVAGRITGAVRATDTIARLVSDQFAVLIEELDSPQQASIVAGKLLGALDDPIPEQQIQFQAQASIGISLYPDDGGNADTLLSHAEVAMAEAKDTSEKYQFFASDMNTSALDSLLLSNNMRTALDRGDFLLHYQPVIDLATDAITGFEALVRWLHPDRGLVSPTEFIPLAEDTGLIGPLGELVTSDACRQTRTWLDMGYRDLRMAVNLSAKQFRDPEFVDRITGILHETGVHPDRLLIEITESIMLPDPVQTRQILEKINAAGMEIAIDDFGTGYSSLAYLRDFSIDYLKIDRSFVSSLPDDKNACTIIRTIIAMAKNLDLKVIAEGVETASQLEFLRNCGCDEAQGFYFGKPMPPAEAEMLLASRIQRV